jgi:hypothetical protein
VIDRPLVDSITGGASSERLGSGHLDVDNLLSRSSSFAPWSGEHLTRLVLANGIGILLMIVGWYQTTGSHSVDTRISWLEMGILGLFVTGVANVRWLLRGFEAVSAARSMVAQIPVELRETQMSRFRIGRPLAGTAGALVWVEGTARFHVRGCDLVSGKSAQSITSEEARSLLACEVCLP